MRKTLAALAIVLLSGLASEALADPSENTKKQVMALYDTQVTSTEGATDKLINILSWEGGKPKPGNYQGKLVVLNMWAHWCASCVAEMASFKQLRETIGRNQIEVILLSRPENWEKDKEYARTHNFDFPLYVVGPQNSPIRVREAYQDYGNLFLPQTIIYDRNGTPRFRQAGSIAWDAPQMVQQVRSYLTPVK